MRAPLGPRFCCSILIVVVLLVKVAAQGQELRLPPRKAHAVGGMAFAASIAPLPLEEREARILQEVEAGNVPDFLRNLVAVPVTCDSDGETLAGHVFVTPDYLAVGSNDDYLYVPLTPYTAQKLADKFHCVLPTPKIVDAVYAAATVKLNPTPIPPGAAMTTVPEFVQITHMIADQRRALTPTAPLGSLVAGDKKDVVICAALKTTPGHVAIYGWHKPDGKPIQPLYLGHIATWADYSHGIRLVSRTMDLDGKPRDLVKVLRDPRLCSAVSDEGPVTQARYVFHVFPHAPDESFHLLPGETVDSFTPTSGVRVVIDRPDKPARDVQLVIYALPNGNSIEETMGRKLQPDDDWHFDIQHIAAQTRFVRHRLKNESLVVAYLEAGNKSWPAWFRSHPLGQAVEIFDAIVRRVGADNPQIVLDSHSGGGAFLFAYIASVAKIPDSIHRISFLDSEYAYDPGRHAGKLEEWLKSGDHYLCAIAYDDASALYEGKPFIGAADGTWGRTHAMLEDLGRVFDIARTNRGDPERYTGLNGNITFWLKNNPTHQILHTVQVERNGFIESLLSGTELANRGYRYFGRRAYGRFVAP